MTETQAQLALHRPALVAVRLSAFPGRRRAGPGWGRLTVRAARAVGPDPGCLCRPRRRICVCHPQEAPDRPHLDRHLNRYVELCQPEIGTSP